MICTPFTGQTSKGGIYYALLIFCSKWNVSNYIDKERGQKRLKKLWRGVFEKILAWDKIEKIHGPKGLENVKRQRNWTLEEKLTFVLQILNGKTLTEVSFSEGISDGLLSSWVHKYLTYGYNGLKNKKRGRPLSKEPIMNKKAVPDNLSESEREELVRLRERNAYLEAEIAVIKKWEPWEKNRKLRFSRRESSDHQGITRSRIPTKTSS